VGGLVWAGGVGGVEHNFPSFNLSLFRELRYSTSDSGMGI